MSELSDAAELLVLDWLLGTGTPTRPAASALCLDTTTITDADTGATISEPPDANGYDRQTCAFGAAAAGSASNSALESFGPNITTNWGTITDFCICDTLTYASGGMVVFSPLDVAKAVTVGDTLEFAIGAVVVTAA